MDKFPLMLAGKPTGELITEREAYHTRFFARCHLSGKGIWCAWIVGERGEVRLGLLEPVGEQWVIRRTFSHRMTEPVGRILRGEIRPIRAEHEKWEEIRRPEQVFQTPWLQEAVRGLQGGMVQWEDRKKHLAIPYDPDQPFPLTALFCFARLSTLGENRYLIVSFDEKERPIMPWAT